MLKRNSKSSPASLPRRALRRFACAAALFALFIPAARGQSTRSAEEDNLYGELANHGLDDLLKRALETDHVPPDQQSAIWSLSSLHRLETASDLSEDQRQALLQKVVSGLDKILAALNGDPALIVKEAGILAEKGVDYQTAILEYWGPTPAEKARLRPLAEAALKMYDQAYQLSNQQATDLANRITSPTDKLADQWRKMSDIASAAEYQKARMQYALALSLDPTDPRRGPLIDEALKSFDQWDNADSGIQPQVRLLEAKLRLLTGDPDDVAVARKKLKSIIGDSKDKISPEPSPEMVFEAKCFSVIADLGAQDLDGAQADLADATDYQQARFSGDQDQAAALRLLRYRILAQQADALPAGNDKDTANAAAVNALSQLIRDFPAMRGIIFRQLAARLPAHPDVSTLDPMLLLSIVDEGRQEVIAAGAGKSPDRARLEAALGASREIVARYAAHRMSAAEALEPSFLIGFFQQYLGDKAAAAEALLDHIARFGNDPAAHADVALETAGSLIAQLRQASPADPQVQRLEERFLPVAIAPPFNRREFALQYAGILLRQNKWNDALKYYKMVPDTEPPARLLIARDGELAALQNELDNTPGLEPAQRQRLVTEIQALADRVKSLAGSVSESSTSEDDRNRAKSTLANVSLIAAQIAGREQNDPHRVLQLLQGFEQSVQGLPNANTFINAALFLRVQAYMQLGQDNEAVQTLIEYLKATSAAEGEQTVYDLLSRLNKELDQARGDADAARARNDAAAVSEAETRIRHLADNRAMLSGYLVKWAQDSTDPKVHSSTYIYRRFEADTKRQAADEETDPAQRRRDLAAALDLYKQLQSPENVALYQAGIDPASGIDKDYPDPPVTLGIGLIAYDMGDCKTVKATLGRLIQDEKLAENTDQYWEAAYKLLDCMRTLAAKGDPDTPIAHVQQNLKLLFLIWRDGTGGKNYHDKFEALRKEVLPNWTPPANPVNAAK